MKRTLVIPTLLGLLWSLLLAALFVWSALGERRHILDLAEKQARAMFQQIVATRSWNSAFGGVYVPRGENVEPNPYLPAEERTLRAEGGLELVKVNPAFMTRLIADIASERNDVRFHLTSLSPVRPENAPDPWERLTLAGLAPSADRFELVPAQTGPGSFRYMAPLVCETSCVQCHTTDTVGALRGAITVTVPAGPLLTYQDENLRKQAVAYSIIWVIGLLGLGGTSYELNRRREMAEVSNQTKSRFLANMSHDMRTPLTGILGLTERMLERRELTAQGERYAGLIAHSARTLLEIVGDILDCARIDSGRLDLADAPFCLREAVERTTTIFAFAAREKGLDFLARVDDSTPKALRGDEFRYRQVLANLLGNAVKFTERGAVALTVSARDDGRGACLVRTVVEDSGVGIARTDPEAVFEPFSQVDDTLSRRHAGSGLGLSIARQLARMMGGDVTVTSEPGQGSVFVFTARFTPCDRPAPEALDPALRVHPPLPARPLADRTVLAVDDHRANRVLLTDILEEDGALPLTAQSGEEALALVRCRPVDLVLMDLQMPGMGGVEAIARLRDLERELGRPKTPVVVLTAFASPAEATALPLDEIAAVVEKPLDVALLRRTMLAALEGAPESEDRQVGAHATSCTQERPDACARSDRLASSDAPATLDAYATPDAHAMLGVHVTPNAHATPDAPATAAAHEAGRTAGPDASGLLDPGPALTLLSGRRDFYEMLAGEFLDSSPGLRQDFDRAVDRGDRREAARIAHTLKAGAAAVGAVPLGAMAADLERQAKAGGPVSPAQRRDLAGLLDSTLRALRQSVAG